MAIMHYLPAQHVTRDYEERLVIRGEDVATLVKLLEYTEQTKSWITAAEADFMERVQDACYPYFASADSEE